MFFYSVLSFISESTMFKSLCLFVYCNVLITCSNSNSLLIEKKLDHIGALTRYAQHITLNFCYRCSFISVITDQKSNKHHTIKDIMIKNAFRSYRPIIMTNDVPQFVYTTYHEVTSEKHIGTTALLIVLVADINPDTFLFVISDIHVLQYFGSKTNVAIIFYKPIKEVGTEWLENLFKMIWRWYLLRVVVVFYSTHTSGIEVVTFNPFENNYYINMTLEAEYAELFYEKIQNMNGYPLYIVANRFMGYMLSKKKPSLRFIEKDDLTVYTVIKHLNATGIVARRTENLKNTSSIKVADNYDLSKVDVVFEPGSVIKEKFLEGLYPHEQDDICVVVPRGEAIPQVLYMFMVFEISVWCSLLLTMVVGTVAYFYLNKYIENRNMRSVIVYIIRSTLAGPWGHLPHKSAERLLVCSWCLFGVLITSFFISELTSTLIEKKYYPDINTLQELESTNWKIYGTEEEVELVQSNYGNEGFKDRFVGINFFDVVKHFPGNRTNKFPRSIIYRTIAYMRKPVLMSKERALHFLQSKESYKHGRRTFSLMSECPFPNQVSYSVTKGRGTIYAAKVNDIIKRLYFSGIIEHWKSIAEIFNSNDVKLEKTVKEEEEENGYLSLFHLQTAFYLLAAGLIISIVAFNVELLYAFTERHCKRYIVKNKSNKYIVN